MKKITFTIILSLGLAFSMHAQDNAAFKKDALKLAEMGSKSAEASLSQIYTMIPEDKIEAFKKDLNPVMQDFYKKLGEKSMEYYTHDEVKAILNFYETEVGQKHLKVQEEMTMQAMSGDLAQELQQKLMPILEKYMSGY